MKFKIGVTRSMSNKYWILLKDGEEIFSLRIFTGLGKQKPYEYTQQEAEEEFIKKAKAKYPKDKIEIV